MIDYMNPTRSADLTMDNLVPDKSARETIGGYPEWVFDPETSQDDPWTGCRPGKTRQRYDGLTDRHGKKRSKVYLDAGNTPDILSCRDSAAYKFEGAVRVSGRDRGTAPGVCDEITTASGNTRAVEGYGRTVPPGHDN
jgi:hypothetical protein